MAQTFDGPVTINGQDGLNTVGFQPVLTLTDSNAGNARGRMQCANGDISFQTESFIANPNPGNFVIIKTGSGNVGIGTANPNSKLEVHAQDGLNTVGFQPVLTLTDSNAGNARGRMQCANGDISFQTESFIANPNPGNFVIIKTGSGNVGIGTSDPTSKLEVVGDVAVTGDIRLTNKDCAEDFDIADANSVEPGTVMVLGEEGGVLYQSRQAYDKRVAGVVSGAGNYKPGIVLGKEQSRSDRKPIALVGKVFCKVDASHGQIEVGDLLTTSPTPGHVMKASDPLKAFGAVIGKALCTLKEGQGLVPILIALQ
jgi:hypothetical protein